MATRGDTGQVLENKMYYICRLWRDRVTACHEKRTWGPVGKCLIWRIRVKYTAKDMRGCHWYVWMS